jgi:hypothetical protein
MITLFISHSPSFTSHFSPIISRWDVTSKNHTMKPIEQQQKPAWRDLVFGFMWGTLRESKTSTPRKPKTVRAKEPRKPSRKLIRMRTKSLPGFGRRSIVWAIFHPRISQSSSFTFIYHIIQGIYIHILTFISPKNSYYPYYP